jgi:NAD(P)-dependent dehydrogenase (short-subunit alcohol dehydrogenase family)
MRHEIRHMLAAGNGGVAAIVNNASIAGLVGLRGQAAYAASKHA